MAIADLDRDLDLDVVTVHRDSGRVGLLENLLHLQFRGRYLDRVGQARRSELIAVEDVDGNVSWDLIVGGSDETAIVFSHTADAGVWTIDRVVKDQQTASEMIVADFDNDSWLEVLAIGFRLESGIAHRAVGIRSVASDRRCGGRIAACRL